MNAEELTGEARWNLMPFVLISHSSLHAAVSAGSSLLGLGQSSLRGYLQGGLKHWHFKVR